MEVFLHTHSDVPYPSKYTVPVVHVASVSSEVRGEKIFPFLTSKIHFVLR